MRRLRDDFNEAGYVADKVLAAIGDQGQLGLIRNHTLAADRALAGRDDGLATLIRLFVLQQWQPADQVVRVMAADALAELGLLIPDRDGFRAAVDVRPFSDETDGLTGWVVSDHAAELDTRNVPPPPYHVLGVSPASISLGQITPVRPVARAMDLGTGSGIQSLHLARHAGCVVATDVNPRALTLAGLTFALNDAEVTLRSGSLYEPVADEEFDIIVTNPPFVISPHIGPRLVYRETDHVSDGLMREVLTGASPHLAPGGSLHVVGNWAHVAGTSWADRLADWVPRGCDAFIVEREVLDVYEYTEVWLADAGLAGTPGYRDIYQQWLAYFDALHIEAVGLGWITMVNSGSASPRVVGEPWPYPVSQPVASDLMAHLDAMRYGDWTDARLLATRWRLADGTRQETTGVPGEPEPDRVVLRRTDGLQRAVEVDAGLGGVLGACDGQLALGQILDAVASLLDADAQAMREELLPKVRELIARTWLTPVGDSARSGATR